MMIVLIVILYMTWKFKMNGLVNKGTQRTLYKSEGDGSHPMIFRIHRHQKREQATGAGRKDDSNLKLTTDK